MRRQILLVLTTVVLAGTLPISTGVASAQGPPNVMVNVKCPAQSGNGPLNVTVNPWVYRRSQGENAEWKLIITGSGDNRIEIRAKGGWPYPAWRDRCLGHSNLGRHAVILAYRDPGEEWRASDLGGLL